MQGLLDRQRAERAEREGAPADEPAVDFTVTPAGIDVVVPPTKKVVIPPARRRRASVTVPAPAARLVRHEAHVRAFAIWVTLYGALLTMRAAWGTLFAVGAAAIGAPPVIVAVALVLLALGVGLLASGVGLWSYRPWARTTVLGVMGLGALVLVLASLTLREGTLVVLGVGAALASPVLWLLLSSPGLALFVPGYRRLIAADPQARVAWWSSPFFYVPILLIFALIGLVVVGAGIALQQLGSH